MLLNMIRETQAAIQNGTLSCMDVVRQCVDRIEATRNYNLYIEVVADEAMQQAAQLDARLSRGETCGRLAGAVFSIKDVLCWKSHGTTASSKILKGFVAPYTATVVSKLLAEDAILIGRVHCDEFAMGSSNENSCYGPALNPLDPAFVPGGSSGASAAAVALETCHFSVGSDTGGSVRQPAAFCGVHGFKPTYGLHSRYGLIAYASSFDQIGYMVRYVEDLPQLFEITAGKDVNDATTVDWSYRWDGKEEPVAGKLGYLKVPEGLLDPIVEKGYQKVIDKLGADGIQLEAWEMSLEEYLVPTYYILTTAEASSNLSRYDGIRYGLRHPGNSVESIVTNTRTKGFGKEVKRRLMMGTYVLSSGYYDAYYRKAQKVRGMIIRDMDQLFTKVEALLLPVSPVLPWLVGAKVDDPVAVYYADIFTVLANLTGQPGISVSLSGDQGAFPVGIQLIGPRFADDLLFKTGLFLTQLF